LKVEIIPLEYRRRKAISGLFDTLIFPFFSFSIER